MKPLSRPMRNCLFEAHAAGAAGLVRSMHGYVRPSNAIGCYHGLTIHALAERGLLQIDNWDRHCQRAIITAAGQKTVADMRAALDREARRRAARRRAS